jgi:dTDP-4-dehydrorhamnose 3,5-epimerase
MIEGVVIKDLLTYSDERGYFREILRGNDEIFREGFGQFSHSLMYQGVTKAWHIHKIQIDWWYVVSGVIKVALHDTRNTSSTYKETMEFLMGDYQQAKVLRVPPLVAHGCKCISGPANLLYITSKIYDPSDEGRIPYNDPLIGYDWLKGPEIK